ncbi:hypothetical protein [Dictyobacter arantiisoli]|uniref:hypothetical protein n=1 Tax=Dictyobacter arantiisoli TaxID=2014874 RepID=UPI00155B1590|nr:hypothetical protein [Dictyobacter arantiisoli]
MGTPQTPAKGWRPFAIPLEKSSVRPYGAGGPLQSRLKSLLFAPMGLAALCNPA